MEVAALRNSVPPSRAPAYFGLLWTVVLAAAALCVEPLLTLPGELPRLPAAFWVLAALAVATDARPFPAPAGRPGPAVHPSICATFAILLAWGLAPALAAQAVAVLVAGGWRRHRWWRIGYDLAQHACALAAAGAVTALATGDLPGAAGVLGGFGVADLFGGAELPRESPAGWAGAAVPAVAAATWITVRYGLHTAADRARCGGRWWSAVRRIPSSELLFAAALLLLAPLLVIASRVSAAVLPLVVVPVFAVYRMAWLSVERERLARVDPLTGLANRKALVAAVVRELPFHAEQAAKGVHGRFLALLLIDLDRFKHVNDALGHQVGDRLLIEVGNRIGAAVRPADLVARLGGDEFAILATRLRDVRDARAVADRVAAALAEPVPIDGLALDVGGSIGIALYPEHGMDFSMLMRHADVAMYDAKSRGDTVALYAPDSDRNSPERLSLLADLRRVLLRRYADPADPADPAGPRADADAGEISVYYQPQIAIDTGTVVGVEALLRWRHPRRGMVDPEEFIRVAEQSSVMRLLTRWVLDDVLEQLAKWSAAGLRLRASVNVSVRDLQHGELVDQIEQRLTGYGLPADRLQLEITEGALMADPRRVLATLSRLDRLGVRISLDDFGTGYSSMQHLRRLPLAEVKVDRSFVLGMADDPDDEAIVRSVIELGGALGLRVVAEGVEDERTWRLLHTAGCQFAQGWFYARPMPAEDLTAWLARYRPLRPGAAREPSGRHRRGRPPGEPVHPADLPVPASPPDQPADPPDLPTDPPGAAGPPGPVGTSGASGPAGPPGTIGSTGTVGTP
ncbi:EAL domain-containing protein [Solwaraspora sp. WMMD1047]|uniref:putative bifunctional diguanylate cyclase/phosphodiesterase n=1 Tax=Solwaraspora sp. WMMD1047 TaxID=3016102 RepID=UPI002416C47B|nr:EAL domain-containing protein [Solwaraspora sp. WMMD1047]MDG4829395.1 EAL domain-containing protein [Solwaraspora sp. WMMD1047]